MADSSTQIGSATVSHRCSRAREAILAERERQAQLLEATKDKWSWPGDTVFGELSYMRYLFAAKFYAGNDLELIDALAELAAVTTDPITVTARDWGVVMRWVRHGQERTEVPNAG